MTAQNCQARLLFENFAITVYYKWESNYAVTYNDGSESNSFLAEGTWKHNPLKLDFTKRELSCPALLAHAKASATNGWAHKQIDTPIVRDFSMGYPYPAFNEGIGYEYPSEYYVDQIPHGDVPLIDKLLVRQPVGPIQSSASVPFYFKNEDGRPPNLPGIYALMPDETLFETKEDYQKWLDKWLNKTASPVYFPNAPNDPEYAIPPIPLENRKIPTLFPTKTEWLNFRNKAGGHGQSLCGGNAQCGVKFSLVNDPEHVINCSSSSTIILEDQPPEHTSGTAVVRSIPVFDLSYMDFFSKVEGAGIGYTRTAKKDEFDKILVDRFGNMLFDDWVNDPPTNDHAQYLRVLMGVWQPGGGLVGFPFFNKNQKICSQFREYVKDIPLPKVWTLLVTLADREPGLPYEDATENFSTWAAFSGSRGWDRKYYTTFEETDTSLTWSTEASSSFDDGMEKGDFSMSCTVTWTWTDL